MNGESILKVLKAHWILPMSSEALRNACVVISGNTIENIVPESQLNQFMAGREYIFHDYGESIILPGFINLHTHLEHTNLSGLAKKSTFLDWLPTLIEATTGWSFEDRMHSAQRGVQESMAAGTTFVVDTSYNGASAVPLAKSGVRAIIGLETFGIDESTAKQQWLEWLERYNSLLSKTSVNIARQEERLAITVAPHAPYTVCPALWREAVNWSKNNGLPILTHLCESKAELNWFRSEDKDLKQFLIYAFGKRIANFAQLYESQLEWKSANLSPVEHLDKQGLLTNNLLAAHCVQIDDRDISLLKSSGVSVAHCPNSNIMLKCGRTPLEKLLANNVPVGLGTDSTASSNNLALLSEAKFAINLHQSNGHNFALGAKEALELITIKAAQCLGLGHRLGSLQSGNLADIAVFTLPKNKGKNKEGFDNPGTEPYALLVQGLCTLQELWVDGKIIYSAIDAYP